jgi:hypothetical protein
VRNARDILAPAVANLLGCRKVKAIRLLIPGEIRAFGTIEAGPASPGSPVGVAAGRSAPRS